VSLIPAIIVASVADTYQEMSQVSLIPARNVASVTDTYQEMSQVSLIPARNKASVPDPPNCSIELILYVREMKFSFFRKL
jgi:hypothetical protein